MAWLCGPILLLLQEEEKEERRARRRARARLQKRIIRDAQNPFDLPEAEFMLAYHLSKEACEYVIGTVGPHMDKGRYSNRVPFHLRIFSALNFFACGSYQGTIGKNTNLSQSMVSRSIKEFVNVLVRRCYNTWIRFPRNNADREKLKNEFHLRYRMDNILGVVDATQIAINTPAINAQSYVNRKGYHSLNVQFICDADSNIIHIVAKSPGSTHDSTIWHNSRIAQAMRANYDNGDHNSILMGDSGYACLPWLMVPLANATTESEKQFNNHFKITLGCAEKCIGALKGRFRCLLKEHSLYYTPQNMSRIICACAVLHNIAKSYNVDDPEPVLDEIDLDSPELAPIIHLDAEYLEMGQESRRRYVEEFF